MKVTETKITPELAREYLKLNTRNRPVSQQWVDVLASDMVNGRFRDSFDPVMFRESDGSLGNGQHRLLAVVQSGATITLGVARNVPDEVIDNHDRIRARTIGHLLQIQDGLANANLVAGSARAIVSVCCYYQTLPLSMDMTRSVVGEFTREINVVIEALRGFKPAFRSWCIGTLAFALSADRQVLPFIEQLGSGENLVKGKPAFAVREWLVNSSSARSRSYFGTRAQGLLNAAFNAVHNQNITTIKKGVNGIDYFTAKKRKTVSEIREQMKQLIA